MSDKDDAAAAKPAAPAKPVKAEVTKAFPGVPDGKHDAEDFEPGDEITGDLARAMIAAGFAKAIKG